MFASRNIADSEQSSHTPGHISIRGLLNQFCRCKFPLVLHERDEQKRGLGGSFGCAFRLETRKSWVQPSPSRQHSFVEIDHEIFSTVILSLLLIQEGQLSVPGERMCTILVNRLED